MEKILKYSLVALLGISVAMVFWAVFTTPEDPTTETATAVGAYLYWGYFLMGAALVAALVGAGMDLLKKPEGIKGALISVVAVVAIIVLGFCATAINAFCQANCCCGGCC